MIVHHAEMRLADDRIIPYIEVDLSPEEAAAHAQFNALLDEGHGIQDSLRTVATDHPNLTNDFWEWLQ